MHGCITQKETTVISRLHAESKMHPYGSVANPEGRSFSCPLASINVKGFLQGKVNSCDNSLPPQNLLWAEGSRSPSCLSPVFQPAPTETSALCTHICDCDLPRASIQAQAQHAFIEKISGRASSSIVATVLWTRREPCSGFGWACSLNCSWLDQPVRRPVL